MDEIINELGLSEYEIEQDENKTVIHLGNDNMYSKVFSTLNNSEDYWENEEEGHLDLDGSKYVFENNDFKISVIADFNDDEYTVEIEELEND